MSARTVAITSTLILSLTGCSGQQPTEPVYFAHVLPLTGRDHIQGRHARQGVELALADARAAGTKAANRDIAVVMVDSAVAGRTGSRAPGGAGVGGPLANGSGSDSSSAGIRAQAVRLATVNEAKVILASVDGEEALEIMRGVRSYDIPVVVTGPRPPGVQDQPVQFLGAAPDARGRLLAKAALEDFKADRVAVLLDSRSTHNQTLVEALLARLRENDKVQIKEWTCQSKEECTQARPHIEEMKPDVIVAALAPSDLSILFDLPSLTKKPAILYAGPDVSPTRLGSPGEGITLCTATAFYADETDPQTKEFIERYHKQFHEKPDLSAALAYEGANLVIETLKRASTPLPLSLREPFSTIEEFTGVTGPIKFENHQAQRRLSLIQRQGSQIKLLRHEAPAAK